MRDMTFGALKSYPRSAAADNREGRNAGQRHREYSVATATLRRGEAEVGLGVVVADVADHLRKRVLVERIFAVLHPAPDPGAQQPAKVFVTRKRREAAGIGGHADERAEQPVIGERAQLAQVSFLVIVEPPGRTKLHLAARRVVGKGAGDAGKYLVHVRVHAE